MADTVEARVLRGLSIEQRLSEIDRRLAELRQARPERPDYSTAAQLVADAQRHATDADRHWRESTARTLLVRQLVVQAYHSAARAHDHAAEAHERSARAQVGNVAEHVRMAEFHRVAADADRQRAADVDSQDYQESTEALPAHPADDVS